MGASSATGKVQIYLSAEYDKQALNLLAKVITATTKKLAREKSKNMKKEIGE